MCNNLPPSVSLNDIPGNRPEDVLYEKLFCRLPEYMQDEIENKTELGLKLDENFQDFIKMVFTEEDVIQQMHLIEPFLREEVEDKKDIIIGKTYSLDLSGSAPVQVEVLDYSEDNKIKCRYLNSNRIQYLDLELFRINGYYLPDDILIEVIEDTDDIPKGSVFYLENITKDKYEGLWTSMMGSYYVSVDKKHCKIKK